MTRRPTRLPETSGTRRRGHMPPLTYRRAGVDLDAAEAALSDVLPALKSTVPDGALREDIGGFSALLNLPSFYPRAPKSTIVSACTDGVGTKIALLLATGRNFVAGIDAVAMCLNDLITSGAQPAFLLDYFAASRFDPDVFKDVLTGITAACKQCNCALVGGETAILPGFFRGRLYDVVGFAVGFASPDSLFPGPASLRSGDLLIGIPSSGPHSNGFSLIRKILQKRRISLDRVPSDLHKPLADLLLAPTYLYPPLLENLAARHPRKVLAAAHITGGGIPANLPRVLPPHLSADLQIPAYLVPPVFRYLQREGNIPDDDLWNTFNMGIGFIIIVRPRSAPALLADIRRTHPGAAIIGKIVPGNRTLSIRVTG